MKNIQNHVAVITGGSRGIGKAIGRALASKGAKVVLAARSARDLDAAVRELQTDGLAAVAVPTDITLQEDVEMLISSTYEKFGRIDTLVNNAGIGVFKPAVEMRIEEFDAMWNVNVRGVFLATKSVLPHMLKAKSGNIVNIASLAGKNSFKGGTGYAATKWALRGFASSLMLEIRESNIRVVTIFPGSVNTHFSSTNLRGDNITQPEDVADAVVFAVTAPERSIFSEIDIRPTHPR
ncbi:MAG: SDR family NAD(P)-dependent oxidoreductase [Ignavibacteria bacterium]|nr:SDR family NAD(P)-dependent oxidoreductase [Ignavibacteria bacterium]